MTDLEPTMLARLGNVLYWLGCGLAAVVFITFMSEAFSGTRFQYEAAIAAVGFALVIWLIGRACRYVLNGN